MCVFASSDDIGSKKTGPRRWAHDPGLWAAPGLGLGPDTSPMDGLGPKKLSSGQALDPGLRARADLGPDPSLGMPEVARDYQDMQI